MTVQLILAPSASGKTHACIQAVRDTLARQPLSPVWVITGDHRQAGYFRKRLALAGGTFGTRIATFGSLYREILSPV